MYHARSAFSVSGNVQRKNEPYRYDRYDFNYRIKDSPDSYLQSWDAHKGRKK